MRLRAWLIAVAALAAAAPTPGLQPARPFALPARFERFLESEVRPTASERKQLLDGAPMTKLLDADANTEVAVFGAVWINASPKRYVAAVKDIETFERGEAFLVTKRISSPARLADFAAVDLPPEDIADLKNCRVGDCELKLDKPSIDAIRARVDFTSPTAKRDVEGLLRQRMMDYVTGYRAKGNVALAVYRDAARPTFVAAEFNSMIDRMPSVTAFLPSLRQYLLQYPAATLPRSTDFLYWQTVRFGLKPTLRISHMVIQEGAAETVVASKMLYASHYFWTGLELRVLASDPARGPGFWFITVNRSRSDGLSGFTGFFVRGRVRDEVEKGALAVLSATKKKLEAPAPR